MSTSFLYTVAVPNQPQDGHPPRFWAIQALGQNIGDCIFEETECKERSSRIEYTFTGERSDRKIRPKEVKPKKKPKAKQSLAKRLGL